MTRVYVAAVCILVSLLAAIPSQPVTADRFAALGRALGYVSIGKRGSLPPSKLTWRRRRSPFWLVVKARSRRFGISFTLVSRILIQRPIGGTKRWSRDF